MPRVSVLMPMRNAEPYIQAALASVLGQRDVDLEVVIMDDGSTDRSAALVQAVGDSRVRLLPGPCQGISAALNAALTAARGDIITRCDADDLYPDNRLAWQVQWLEDHPEFGAVCGQFSTITPQGQPIAVLGGDKAEEITQSLQAGEMYTHLCTFAIRAPLLHQLGGFRPYFVTAEDIDLALRLSEIARIWFAPQSFYLYRLHGTSITHSQGTTARTFYEATAKAFAAQRRAGQADDLAQGRPPPPPAPSQDKPTESGEHIQQLLIGQSWREHQAGQKMQSLRTGWRACWARPSHLPAWRNLAVLAWKRSAGPPS